MRKIFYIMHIDWNWIKQRPHFIAEGLRSYADVLVVYSLSKRRSVLVSNPTNLRRVPLVQLPLRRIKWIDTLNTILQKLYVAVLCYWFKPDIIWLTFPRLFTYLPAFARRLFLVYDCMDDAGAFFSGSTQQEILHLEERTVQAASLVFVSSNRLEQKMKSIGCNPEKITLVKNAFAGPILNIESNGADSLHNGFNIAYIGTVSEWIDFNSLLYCVEHVPGVRFHFIGPVSAKVPIHPKMIFHGPMNHSDLPRAAQRFDCMIMPFIINELTKSVDPVKMYEYINYNKNIIARYYEELEVFAPFTFFYRNPDELIAIVRKLKENNLPKFSAEQRLEFLTKSTWDARISTIVKVIHERVRHLEKDMHLNT